MKLILGFSNNTFLSELPISHIGYNLKIDGINCFEVIKLYITVNKKKLIQISLALHQILCYKVTFD